MQLFDDVVVDHNGGKQHEEHKGSLVDALLDLLFDVAAYYHFDQQHQHEAAIENGDGEQIEESQLQADQGHETQEFPRATHGRPSGFPGHSHGARELFDGSLAPEDLSQQLKDKTGVRLAVIPRLLQS